MNELRAFLHSIHEQPDDDTPRLMLADWLTEHGQPERGEFIHIQCALARMRYDDPRRPDFVTQQRELLNTFGRMWAEPLLDLVADWESRRGFLEAVSMRAARFVADGPALFETEHPVREVRLMLLSGWMQKLVVECETLSRLSGLSLRRALVSDEDCLLLANSPHLSGLRWLDLGHNHFGARGVAALVESALLPALERLDLSGNRTFFVYRGSQFLGSPGLQRIREVHLGLTGLGDEGMSVLAETSHLSRLRSLFVPNTTLTDSGIRGLVGSPYLTELEELDLSGNYFGTSAACALADWPGSRWLRKLWLHNNAIGDAGVLALARSPHLEQLEFLSIGSSSISRRGVDALRDRFGESILNTQSHPATLLAVQ